STSGRWMRTPSPTRSPSRPTTSPRRWPSCAPSSPDRPPTAASSSSPATPTPTAPARTTSAAPGSGSTASPSPPTRPPASRSPAAGADAATATGGRPCSGRAGWRTGSPAPGSTPRRAVTPGERRDRPRLDYRRRHRHQHPPPPRARRPLRRPRPAPPLPEHRPRDRRRGIRVDAHAARCLAPPHRLAPRTEGGPLMIGFVTRRQRARELLAAHAEAARLRNERDTAREERDAFKEAAVTAARIVHHGDVYAEGGRPGRRTPLTLELARSRDHARALDKRLAEL